MKSKANIMHEAALRIIESYHQNGDPFTLFLSSWPFDMARKLLFSLMGRNGDVQVRIGLERQVRIMLKQDGLETVAVYREGDDQRIAIPQEWPALTMPEKEWKRQIEQLAGLADLIVVFWGVTSDSLAEELDICSADANRLKTVAIVPAEPRDIFLSQMHQVIPRIVPLNEIPPFIGLHPEFDPLIQRMKVLKALDSNERRGLIEQSERVNKFPLPPTSERFAAPFWIEMH